MEGLLCWSLALRQWDWHTFQRGPSPDSESCDGERNSLEVRLVMVIALVSHTVEVRLIQTHKGGTLRLAGLDVPPPPLFQTSVRERSSHYTERAMGNAAYKPGKQHRLG